MLKWIAIPFLVSKVFAASVLPLPNIHCENEVLSLLKSAESKNEWSETADFSQNRKRFKSPTGTYGKWIYLESNEKTGQTILALHSEGEMLSTEFDKSCKKTVRYDHVQFQHPPESATDQDLLKLAQKEKDYFVYIWSPEMPLSIPTLTEVQSLASEQNKPLHVFLYYLSSKKYAETIAKQQHWPNAYLQKLYSFEFSMRNQEAHQPVLFRLKEGKVWGLPQFGYKSKQEFMANLKSFGEKK